MGLLWALFTISHARPAAFTLMVLIGLVAALFSVLQTTLLQLTTAPEHQGTALGLQEFAIGAIPVASIGLGAAAQLVGMSNAAFVSSFLLTACMAVLGICFPGLLRYHGTPWKDQP